MLGQIGDLHAQGATFDSLGYAYHHLGRYREAIDCYEAAAARFDEFGDRYNRANVLTHLGETYLAPASPLSRAVPGDRR